MGTKDRVTIELYVDDQGTVKIRQAKVAVEELGPAGERSGRQLASGLDNAAARAENLGKQLLALVGITASVAGAAYLGEKAFSSGFSLVKGGISIVDDFQKKIIGTSYILSTMSEVAPVDLSKTYGQWKDYFAWLYQQSLYADKMAAASAADIFNVSVELAKKGVVATTQEEILTISRLTDLMKAVTPGYMNFEQQARGEIMAMIEGTARMGAQTAQILSQIDPAFKKNITSAREQGTVLEYINSILPQIKQYTLDLMGTWDAVGASLKSAWQVINLNAFANAHREVVSWAQELGNKLLDNGKLTEQGERAAIALGKAWEEAKGYAKGAMDYVLNNMDELIGKIEFGIQVLGRIAGITINIGLGFLSVIDSVRQFGASVQVGMVEVRASIGYTIEWFGIMGTAIKEVTLAIIWNFEDIGPAIDKAYAQMEASSNRWSRIAVQDANEVRNAVLNSMIAGKTPAGFNFMEGLTGGVPLPVAPPGATGAPPTPPIRPFSGKEGTGGGGGRDTAETLGKLILQLEEEKAKLAEGAFAGVEAWYNKITEKIKKLAMDDEQLKAGMLAATELKAAKEEKITDDLNKKYLAATHQTSALQLQEDLKRISDVAGHEAEAGKAREILYQNAQERSEKLALAENQQQKTYYDALAGSSILIRDQVTWKEMSWQAEKKISQEQLEQWFKGKDITASQKDEYRGLLALTNAAKEYNLARQKAVDLGTLEGWAIERAGEALKREKTAIKDMMTGVEGFFQDAFAQGIQGALSGGTKSFKEVGKTIVQSMILEMGKRSFTHIWDNIAKMIAGAPQSTTGGSGTGTSLISKGLGGGLFKGMTKDMQTYYKGWLNLNKEMTKDWNDTTTTITDADVEAWATRQTTLSDSLEAQTGITTVAQTAMSDTTTAAQEAMTGATEMGEVTRLATLSTKGVEGIGILEKLAKSAILVSAARAAASAYSSVMEALPWPINMIVAPIAAAVSFAAVAAFGAMGGSFSGGGSTTAHESTASAYHAGALVAHAGMLVAHGGLNLLPDERLIIAQTGEGILPRTAMRKLGPAMFEMLRRGDFDSGGGYGGPRAAQVVHHTSNITIVTPEGKVLGKHQINQVMGEVQKRITHREIRVPANRRG